MKNIIEILLSLSLVSTSFMHSQESNLAAWVYMKDEKVITLEFTKSETLSLDEFSFRANWDDKLSYSENIGYYGGISELQIYKNQKHIQTIKNIEDGIALGNINISFYDYNMDGYIDFTLPIDCGKSCYDAYYLFDPQTQKFQHHRDWDYLRIQRINKSKKQILTIPDGTARHGEQILYRLDDKQLIKLKTIKY